MHLLLRTLACFTVAALLGGSAQCLLACQAAGGGMPLAGHHPCHSSSNGQRPQCPLADHCATAPELRVAFAPLPTPAFYDLALATAPQTLVFTVGSKGELPRPPMPGPPLLRRLTVLRL